jgi:four helix bundle protein
MEVFRQVTRTAYNVPQKNNSFANTTKQKNKTNLFAVTKNSAPPIPVNSHLAQGRIRDFKELRVWVDGMTLVKEIYKVTERFPQKELYGLTSQLRRCAVSVPSNIAEGFQQFLHIALGSLAEAETQILIARDLDYISCVEEKPLLELIDKINRMTGNLRKKVIS